MPTGKVYSDESVLQALQICGSVKAAAAQVGCSERLIYRRMQDDAFRARLAAFRAERIRTVATLLDHATLSATQALVSIAEDENASTADRIKAATAILEQSPRYEERLVALENRTANAGKQTQPIFDIFTVDVWEGYDDELSEDD